MSSLEDAFDLGDPAALAVARARAYVLWAELLRRGVTPETAPHAEALPELKAGLELYRRPEGLDLDAAAAAHQRVLGYEVFPWASVYLDPAGRGGPAAEAIYASFREMGVPWSPTEEGEDDLPTLLDALAFLSGAEAEAWRDDAESQARTVRGHAQALAGRHVWTWWAPFRHAVSGENEPVTTQVLELVQATLQDHVGSPVVAAPDGLETLSDRLEDAHSNLRSLAEFLLVPVWSGVFLSRGALQRLGRSLGLPIGFGTRADRLEAFLRAAAEADLFPDAVAALDTHWHAAREAYATLPGGEAWRARAEATQAGFQRMAAQAASLDEA